MKVTCADGESGNDDLGKEKANTDWKIVWNADNLTVVEGVCHDSTYCGGVFSNMYNNST